MDRELEKALQELEIGSTPSALSIGADWQAGTGEKLTVRSPIDGSDLATFAMATAEQVELVIDSAVAVFPQWRDTPAPVRGELVRRVGNEFRTRKEALARLVAWEVGKIMPEARGEVQEIIDICDFAVGLSRQLYGKTIASERPGHRLSEYWHPLGPIGVISAFNFPVAVWAWNAMIGLVCGDPIVWKPSEKTPLSALACQRIVEGVISGQAAPHGILCVVVGGIEIGQALAASPCLPLVSATG